MNDTSPTKQGRRAKIHREAIAEAVIEIGFDDATMKNVADRLGVSVAGLYHHVRGRSDLLRLATEHLLASVTLPSPSEGQPWEAWLRDLGWQMRVQVFSHPAYILQHISGISSRDTTRTLDAMLETLGEYGFSPLAGYTALQAVTQTALGAAVEDARERELARTGQPGIVQMYAALAADPAGLPKLAELVEELGIGGRDLFDDRLTIVLAGIAAVNNMPCELPRAPAA